MRPLLCNRISKKKKNGERHLPERDDTATPLTESAVKKRIE